MPFVDQPPLRLGLGLVALTFYLWVIHSYKLPAGDIAVLGLGIGVLLRGGQIRIPAPLAVMGLFIAWSAVGLAVTERADLTWTAIVNLGKLWVIVFCIMNLVRSGSELRFVVIAWLAIYALYPIRGALYNQYICHCTTLGRVAWNFIFANPNDLAAISMLPLGLTAAVAVVERVKVWRIAGLLGVGVLALTIMLTQSRAAMLGIGLAAVLLPLSSRRKRRDLFLLAVFLGVAALAAPKGVWVRLAGLTNVSVRQGMSNVDPERSAESRWAIWQIAFVSIREQPLTGVGLDMQPLKHRQEAERRGAWWTVRGERDTHSTYIRLTAEMGFPGLAIYLVMWGLVVAKLRTVRKRLRHQRPREHQALLFVELAVLAYLVASIFGSYGLLSFNYLALTFAWMMADVLEREPWYVPPRLRVLPARR